MHTLGALAALLVFVVRVLAASNYGGCLTQATTDELVTNFIALTNGGAFNRTLARALIAPDVVDTSGSVASVINGGQTGPVSLLGPTLVGRPDFIAQNSAQAVTPYQPLNIYHTCNVAIFRFEIAFKPQPILGITILETVPAPTGNEFPFQIKQVYGELNSYAFLVDLGIVQPPPPPPPSA